MKNLLVLIFIFASTLSQAKLLDKILAVTNDKIFTLSMANRIKKSLDARRNISPMIYKKDKYTKREIVQLMISQIMIRKKLETMGYIIKDDQVESQILSTEKKLGLSRADLLNFLSSKGTSFDEYFELTREAIEFNIFNTRVIRPLISITEQEIKKKYYNENKNNKTISFRYDLVDFTINKKLLNKNTLKTLPKVLAKFQQGHPLPSYLEGLETNHLGNTTEDDLTPALKNLLKKASENKFSKPILLYSDYHIFFLKKKELVESNEYLESKPRIHSMLIQNELKKVTDVWIKRESNKYYIKYFF